MYSHGHVQSPRGRQSCVAQTRQARRRCQRAGPPVRLLVQLPTRERTVVAHRSYCALGVRTRSHRLTASTGPLKIPKKCVSSVEVGIIVEVREASCASNIHFDACRSKHFFCRRAPPPQTHKGRHACSAPNKVRRVASPDGGCGRKSACVCLFRSDRRHLPRGGRKQPHRRPVASSSHARRRPRGRAWRSWVEGPTSRIQVASVWSGRTRHSLQEAAKPVIGAAVPAVGKKSSRTRTHLRPNG
jgi:hypothetical protein